MPESDVLKDIPKDSNCSLSIFQPSEIEELKTRVFIKEVRGKKKHFVKCIIRDKNILLNIIL